MYCIISHIRNQGLLIRVHLLVVLLISTLVLLNQMPSTSKGWFCLTSGVVLEVPCKPKGKRKQPSRAKTATDRRWWLKYINYTWHVVFLRTCLLLSVGYLSGDWFHLSFCVLPFLLTFWQGFGFRFREVIRTPEWRIVHFLLFSSYRVLLFLSVLFLVKPQAEGICIPFLGLGFMVCKSDSHRVEVHKSDTGDYRATLCGHFSLRVSGDEPFRVRLLYIFLRLLEVDGETRGSRRTRDGRTPFVRQQQMENALDICIPELSRFEKYWLEGDWANLLSLKRPLVLTQEVLEEVVKIFAAFPWWSNQQVRAYLHEQGFPVTLRQVQKAAEKSGWSILRKTLRLRYKITAEGFRPNDNYLISSLLSLVQSALEKLEKGEAATQEEIMDVSTLQKLADELDIQALPSSLRQAQDRLSPFLDCDNQSETTDDTIRCRYCGSTNVSRKSRKPRWKKYYDEEGKLQKVAVYRYYCRNSDCSHGSFTHFPSFLQPYSRCRKEVRIIAVKLYALCYSTYRRTSGALGVSNACVYRWVSDFGDELLPVAALFGLVRSSSVVGVDEKYVLVPKNDKKGGKNKRWMYVYFAVDVYTYDLLHIAIFPNKDLKSAQTFLLQLRAKGYHPSAVVTDLRKDYGTVIQIVFPSAMHHECIFHAEQEITKLCREIYPKESMQADKLKKEIKKIFQSHTKKTAYKRYQKLMKEKNRYITKKEAESIFDFLEKHWPKLLNAIESKIIPKTNNSVELVIRRFNQHYQSFCGFDSIHTASIYLSVFEKIYRVTPFSQDACERIRGKSPLELAGYDCSKIPSIDKIYGEVIEMKR